MLHYELLLGPDLRHQTHQILLSEKTMKSSLKVCNHGKNVISDTVVNFVL